MRYASARKFWMQRLVTLQLSPGNEPGEMSFSLLCHKALPHHFMKNRRKGVEKMRKGVWCSNAIKNKMKGVIR